MVTATLIPTPSKELPVPVQVISRKDIEESHANHWRKSSTMLGACDVPRATILENGLRILEDS